MLVIFIFKCIFYYVLYFCISFGITSAFPSKTFDDHETGRHKELDDDIFCFLLVRNTMGIHGDPWWNRTLEFYRAARTL